MVFYECLITTKNSASKRALTDLTKAISSAVIDGGGIVRGVQNHGVRELPHFFRARQTDREGDRYYRRGRFLSIYYDCDPVTLQDVKLALQMDEGVLRHTTLRPRTSLDIVNGTNPKKNPYLALAIKEEEAERGSAEEDILDGNKR
mmetsp:Transcript_745/g.1686  ORF Transcript_745/g.1686 Transcript_745/m.1686 type:complete len:146 (+) Transcript_745:278-715(+)